MCKQISIIPFFYILLFLPLHIAKNKKSGLCPKQFHNIGCQFYARSTLAALPLCWHCCKAVSASFKKRSDSTVICTPLRPPTRKPVPLLSPECTLAGEGMFAGRQKGEIGKGQIRDGGGSTVLVHIVSYPSSQTQSSGMGSQGPVK